MHLLFADVYFYFNESCVCGLYGMLYILLYMQFMLVFSHIDEINDKGSCTLNAIKFQKPIKSFKFEY